MDPVRKLKVKIDAMGIPTIEAEGFFGDACEIATKPIEDALSAGKGVERDYKPEFGLTEEEGVEQHQRW